MTALSSRYDENILLFVANGKWQDIVQKLKPSIDPSLVQRISKNNGGASFRGARFETGLALLSWELKKPRAEVANLVGELLNAPVGLTAEQLTGAASSPAMQKQKATKPGSAPVLRAAQSVGNHWVRCCSENAKPAHKFLLQNGFTRVLELERSDIWYVPGKRNLLSLKRAMHSIVCGARNSSGELVAYDRIPISSEGELRGEIEGFNCGAHPSSSNKLAMRLGFPDNGILYVTKDVLSAMAIFEATGIPTWAVISGDWQDLHLPKHVSTVVLWVNKRSKTTLAPDVEYALDDLQGRGLACGLCIPTRDLNEDDPELSWFDVWQTDGHKAFPTTLQAISEVQSVRAS